MKNSNDDALFTYVTILFCLTPLGLFLVMDLSELTKLTWIVAVAVSGAVFFLMRRYRDRVCDFAALILFSVSIPIYVGSCLATAERVFVGGPSSYYFYAFKMSAIMIAILAPYPVWIGYVMILICLFVPALQVLLLSPQIGRLETEPWATMEIAVLSIFVLRYQLNRYKKFDALVETKANDKARRDFSETARAIRDLTNTPLQSLEMLAELLKTEKLKGREASEHLSAANYKLHEVMQLLEDRPLVSNSNHPAESMDSFEILRQKASPTVLTEPH